MFVNVFYKNRGKLYLAAFNILRMKMNRVFFLFTILVMAWSCKKDDGPGVEVVPPKLLSEVVSDDDTKIIEYLETHFYNYEEFADPPADFDYRIRIDTIAGENSDKKPISEMDSLKKKVVNISSDQFGIVDANEENIGHTLYYLSVRPGIDNKAISVADSVYVRYEGSLLNGEVFDGSLTTPIWFDLARIQGPLQGARGFSEGVSNFKAGGEAIVNDDGTFSVEGYGVGLIIFPSGLGYFNNAQSSIPAYSPLIFKVDVFAVNETDHDNDGIPSIDEDLNKNGYLYDDNTDLKLEEETNVQRAADFLDTDDDGDGTATREEISDANGNIIIPYPDADGDGTPDYLDSDTK